VLLNIPDVTYTSGAQDGLMGMAFGPSFSTTSGDLYLAYTYGAGDDKRTKIVSYEWDGSSLSSPTTLISGLPASGDHNSGRLLYGPDGKLYYSIGDQGANQLAEYCTHNEAQTLPTAEQVASEDWSAYKGKILRLDTDGGIPSDNPTIEGVQSHIYTYGHRNPQGLAFGLDGTLYESEHGPKTDDEVNILEAGGNYGWPYVAGYLDDSAYVYGDWSAATDGCDAHEYDEFAIPDEVPQMAESDWGGTFTEPVRTFYSVADDWDFKDADCHDTGLYFVCWPTIAPSSIAVYDGISGGAVLDGSLLVTSLKLGNLYRMDLEDSSGTPLPGTGEPEILFHSTDRLRRVTASADGTKLYVSTDNAGPVMGTDGHPTTTLDNPGSILVLHE
jgi:PQQ-dependent dehydrogenase (s-GDH family)